LQKTILIGLLLTALVSGVYAQSDTAKIHVGTVHLDFDGSKTNPGFTDLTGHVKITSDNYDLYAADIKVYSAPGTKTAASGIQRAVAVGGAVPGSQVKVITKSGFLAEPSLSTFEIATVLLGAGSDYPKIETGAGHITLTPAQ
jgi:hypothetical protein